MKKIYMVVLLAVGFTANSQIINFTDPVLKAKLLSSSTENPIAGNAAFMGLDIDTNNDNEIQVSEASAVYMINIENASDITNISGLEMFSSLGYLNFRAFDIPSLDFTAFTALKRLYIIGTTSILNISGLNLKALEASSPNLTSLDLTGHTNLDYLFIGSPLTSIDLSNKPLLETLFIWGANAGSLDLSNKPVLKQVSVIGGILNSVNVTGCPKLEDLTIEENQLTTLDVSTNYNLRILYCNGNQFTNLDLSANLNLLGLDCRQNNLTVLDISANVKLINLKLSENPFEQLFLKNGKSYTLGLSQFPSLTYVCADDSNISSYKQQLGSIQCEVNSYCSFTPGGTNYTLNGNSKFDGGNNGCDATDSPAGTVKFVITNGTQSGSILPDTIGNYSAVVGEGTHTLTPILENPSYFTVLPAAVSITFPTQTSPQTNNFCVTANGTKNDIDVNIIPITAAVPGFDVTYKIIYRNIGNSVANGSINLTYQDALFDFVHAVPANTLLPAGLLNWNFVNLLPFETREVYCTLNLNGPMETPAVNSGDVVSLVGNATITNGVDENPNDNTMNLMQTVVNAMDPNDKTCLEGNTITPEMIGKYVHYKIRFENEGTAPAQNIVVKDMIDMAKFDITSLIPLDSNYPFTTRINGNKVEFIFENINLPFDDDLNDGYVVFKIKTLPTLVAGDTFSNTASIYFDYNFPVITDPAVTTVAVLGVTDNEVSAFSISPNPTSGLLNITAKNDAVVKSVTVYNMLGQVVMAVPNAKDIDTVDVSALSAGNYILKVASNKGGSAIPFIKK